MRGLHIIIIFIVALVFKTTGLKAQEQVPQEGRLSASLLIAAPADETPQRAFGHAFLRLRFESTDTLDYCFTQEANAEQTAWDIMCGNYTTRMMAYDTPAYLQQFAEQHRRVETLPLNLTPDEIRRLWQHLDNMIIATEATHSDFVKHSCSQELSNVLFSVVDGYVDLDNAALDGIGDNLFAVANGMRRQSNWGTVLLLFLACGPAFEQSVANDLCFLPTVLPYIFSHAIIVSPDGERSPLLCQASDVSFPDDGMPVYLWLVGIVLLQAVLIMTHRVATLDPIRQTTDSLLLLFYTALSLLLPVVNVVTTQPSLKGWNWTFLFVNMLWAALWLYTKLRKNRAALRIDQAMSGSFMLFALVVFLVPSRFCLEQSIVCLIIALAAWQRSCYLRPYIHSVK